MVLFCPRKAGHLHRRTDLGKACMHSFPSLLIFAGKSNCAVGQHARLKGWEAEPGISWGRGDLGRPETDRPVPELGFPGSLPPLNFT